MSDPILLRSQSPWGVGSGPLGPPNSGGNCFLSSVARRTPASAWARSPASAIRAAISSSVACSHIARSYIGVGRRETMNTLRTGILMAALTGLFLAVGALVGGGTGMLIAFGMALAMNLFAYWNSDKVLLSMYGARQVDAGSAPDLYRLVERLAQQANLPMPKVYITENPQPNAFATGRDPDHAPVCVTPGLLGQVSQEELAGVLAHELGHVKHRDTLTMTITAVMAGAISMLANMAFFMGGSRDRDHPLGMVGVLLVTLLAPIAAV